MEICFYLDFSLWLFTVCYQVTSHCPHIVAITDRCAAPCTSPQSSQLSPKEWRMWVAVFTSPALPMQIHIQQYYFYTAYFIPLHTCGFSSSWTILMILRSHELLSSLNPVRAATSAQTCPTSDGDPSLMYAALWSYLVFPISLYCSCRAITSGASPLIYHALTPVLLLLFVRSACFSVYPDSSYFSLTLNFLLIYSCSVMFRSGNPFFFHIFFCTW